MTTRKYRAPEVLLKRGWNLLRVTADIKEETDQSSFSDADGSEYHESISNAPTPSHQEMTDQSGEVIDLSLLLMSEWSSEGHESEGSSTVEHLRNM